jgi:hypothetical protein
VGCIRGGIYKSGMYIKWDVYKVGGTQAGIDRRWMCKIWYVAYMRGE